MKPFVSLIFSLVLAVFEVSADPAVGGPKGGRLLESEGIRAEFFVEKDHSVTLTFYNDKLERIPAGEQQAAMIAETSTGKKRIEFDLKNGELSSKEPLPEGRGYVIVVQLKQDASSKAKNFRIPFETSVCGECGRAEYACTCEGH